MKSFYTDLALLGLVSLVVVGGMAGFARWAEEETGALGVFDNGWLFAATTATVSATVTFQSFSVTVQDGSVAYGTLAAAATRDTTPGSLNDEQRPENNGNATEKINIKGYDSASWTLVSGTPGADAYRHRFSTDDGSNWSALLTSYLTYEPSVAAGASPDLHLEILMGTSSATSSQQSTDVTLQAVAP